MEIFWGLVFVIVAIVVILWCRYKYTARDRDFDLYYRAAVDYEEECQIRNVIPVIHAEELSNLNVSLFGYHPALNGDQRAALYPFYLQEKNK